MLADKIITIARCMQNYSLFCGVNSAVDFTRATNRDKSGLKDKLK